jgi:hypothetical protein
VLYGGVQNPGYGMVHPPAEYGDYAINKADILHACMCIAAVSLSVLGALEMRRCISYSMTPVDVNRDCTQALVCVTLSAAALCWVAIARIQRHVGPQDGVILI